MDEVHQQSADVNATISGNARIYSILNETSNLQYVIVVDSSYIKSKERRNVNADECNPFLQPLHQLSTCVECGEVSMSC